MYISSVDRGNKDKRQQAEQILPSRDYRTFQSTRNAFSDEEIYTQIN